MVFKDGHEMSKFICMTIWDAYGYPYECVSDTEWDECCESFQALYIPGMLTEVLEKFLIAFVYHQALRDGWVDILLSVLAAEVPE